MLIDLHTVLQILDLQIMLRRLDLIRYHELYRLAIPACRNHPWTLPSLSELHLSVTQGAKEQEGNHLQITQGAHLTQTTYTCI